MHQEGRQADFWRIWFSGPEWMPENSLAGGAIAGVVVYLFLSTPVRRTLGRGLALVFLAVVLSGSAFQFGKNFRELKYPSMEMVRQPAVRAFPLELDLPKGWDRDLDETGAGKDFARQYVGPLSERLEIILGENDEPIPTVLKQYADDRTRGLVDVPDVKLRAVRDPEKVVIGGKDFYRLQWRFSSGHRPLVERDYFRFEGEQVILLQCLLPTDHDDRYQPILEKMLGSMKLVPFSP